MTGGRGSDRFHIGDINPAPGRLDRITDFTGAGGERDALFIGRTTGRVWYERKDADGDGDTDTVIYADANGHSVHAVLEGYHGALESGHFVDSDGNATTLTIEVL